MAVVCHCGSTVIDHSTGTAYVACVEQIHIVLKK